VTTEFEQIKELLAQARQEIAKVVIGQEKVVDHCLIAILAGQHALLEGVPGVAKTLLVNTLAKVLGCDFKRIQMTPDLMPTDIIGTNIFDMKTQTFTLVKGPIFTTFLLADEINRAPAKTQSALLQAMQERSVVIDRENFTLDPAFTVFATQNPVEHEGTYPLPEAQKDRFMLKINVEYPQEEQEITLAHRFLSDNAPEKALCSNTIEPVLEPGKVMETRKCLQAISIREELVTYATQIIRSTRTHESLLVGGSPRATMALLMGSRVLAAIEGRDYVTPDDIKSLAKPVLVHRVILRPEYEIEGLTVDEVIEQILQQVTVPR